MDEQMRPAECSRPGVEAQRVAAEPAKGSSPAVGIVGLGLIGGSFAR
ncbi:hypothetical protein COLSTE_01510, partial [Collinsella stercoris DSM 13279]